MNLYASFREQAFESTESELRIDFYSSFKEQKAVVYWRYGKRGEPMNRSSAGHINVEALHVWLSTGLNSVGLECKRRESATDGAGRLIGELTPIQTLSTCTRVATGRTKQKDNTRDGSACRKKSDPTI